MFYQLHLVPPDELPKHDPVQLPRDSAALVSSVFSTEGSYTRPPIVGG